MKIGRTGSTPRQTAYAKRVWAGQGISKKEIALNVGYSKAVASSPKSKIEDKKGFNNAFAKLAIESNSTALAVMAEFKARGFKDFSNKDLVGALNAIGNAWAKFNGANKDPNDLNTKLGGNKLRTVILQRVENQTISKPVKVIDVETKDAETADAQEESTLTDDDLDF